MTEQVVGPFVVEADENVRLKKLRRRVNRARNFPDNTCGASRHLHIMADVLSSGRPYPMLQEEPTHCAETFYAVIAALWEARTTLARIGAMANGSP